MGDAGKMFNEERDILRNKKGAVMNVGILTTVYGSET